MNINAFYQQRITQLETLKTEQKASARQLSLFRILSFLASAACIYFYFENPDVWIFIPLAILTFAFFLRFVSKAIDLNHKIQLTEKLIFINQNEVQIIDNQPSKFYDATGRIDVHSFDFDLNIFGKYSIFHLINRTGFLFGTERLVQLFKNQLSEKSEMELYQEITKELSLKHDFRQNILANGLLIETSEQHSLQNLIHQKNDTGAYKSLFWKFGNLIFSAITVLIVALSIVFGVYKFIFIWWITGTSISGNIRKKVGVLHQSVSKQKRAFDNLLSVFSLISSENFENSYLKSLQNQSIEAQTAFADLAKIANKFDQRNNMLASALLNGFFLYDIHCVKELLGWQSKYQNSVQQWFEALAEIEVFNSLATFHFNNPDYVFPKIDTENVVFEAKSLAHPLISAKKRVANDVKLGYQKNMYLLTGANMSGKSTFLRSIGINLILAQIGSPVCAKSLIFSSLKIQTSLHQTDSLEENKSYFYAELERIQRIVQKASQEKCLILLDEVLRGTNSEDKRNGTSLLIKRLMKEKCLSIIATHDVELGQMEKDFAENLENLCFESQIIDDELIFDYTLRHGIAQNKNATFLMEKMGIV